MKTVTPEKYIKPSRFMKFEVGENIVRVVSDIYLYEKYGLRAAGRYISQIIWEGQKINPMFSKQDPKKQWGFICWSYKHEEFKVIETGPTLGDALANLLKSDDEYKNKDIVVKRVGTRKEDTKYQVDFSKENSDTPERTPAMEANFQAVAEYFKKPDVKG